MVSSLSKIFCSLARSLYKEHTIQLGRLTEPQAKPQSLYLSLCGEQHSPGGLDTCSKLLQLPTDRSGEVLRFMFQDSIGPWGKNCCCIELHRVWIARRSIVFQLNTTQCRGSFRRLKML